MSILRTYNLQSIDSSNSNIQLTENAGAIVSGLTTVQSGLHVTSGTVGIGTDDPQGELHVKRTSSTGRIIVEGAALAQIGLRDNAGGTDSKVIQIRNNAQNLLIGTQTDSYQSFSEKVRITSSGNFGINEINPIHKLSVGINASTAWDSTKNISNTTNNDFIALNIDNQDSGTNPEVGIMLQAGSSGSGQYTINCLKTNVNTGDLIIRTRDGGAASKEQLRITSVGHVGIGTDVVDSHLTLAAPSASARLELRRTNAAGTGSYGAINFTALDGHSVASIHAQGDGDGDDNGGDIVFRTTSAATSNDPYAITERVRIASDGRIGLSGENYGTDNQVLTSQGTGVPEWRGVNAAFYGRQDTAHNINHATWTVVKNFASDAVNTITGWSESTGIFTANADTAGTYYVFGSAGIDDVQSLDVTRVGISKNNETPQAFVEYRSYSGSANSITGGIMVARVVTLADGDTVRMKVYHNESTTEPTEPNRCFFGGFRLSV